MSITVDFFQSSYSNLSAKRPIGNIPKTLFHILHLFETPYPVPFLSILQCRSSQGSPKGWWKLWGHSGPQCLPQECGIKTRSLECFLLGVNFGFKCLLEHKLFDVHFFFFLITGRKSACIGMQFAHIVPTPWLMHREKPASCLQLQPLRSLQA